MKKFTIAAPSFHRLVIYESNDYSRYPGNDIGFVVNAPCLKSLKIFDCISHFCSLVKMPELVKAEIDVKHSDPKKLLRYVTSAKHLSLCLKPLMVKSLFASMIKIL